MMPRHIHSSKIGAKTQVLSRVIQSGASISIFIAFFQVSDISGRKWFTVSSISAAARVEATARRAAKPPPFGPKWLLSNA